MKTWRIYNRISGEEIIETEYNLLVMYAEHVGIALSELDDVTAQEIAEYYYGKHGRVERVDE